MGDFILSQAFESIYLNSTPIPRVFAVVVAYEPDSTLLERLVRALTGQVAGGVVVNNGMTLPLSDESLRHAGFGAVHLQSNVGVASALNAGFEWAETQGAEFVITFDQDSEPAPDMVPRLLQAYRDKVGSGQKVGAVGPLQIDRRTKHAVAFIAPIFLRRCRIIPARDMSSKLIV